MNQALKIILVSALATAAVIKGAPALAEGGPEQKVSVVRTGDLDLSTAHGQRALDRRLVQAAVEVCGSASDADPVGKNRVRDCRHEVLSTARSQSRAMMAARAAPRTIQVAAVR